MCQTNMRNLVVYSVGLNPLNNEASIKLEACYTQTYKSVLILSIPRHVSNMRMLVQLLIIVCLNPLNNEASIKRISAGNFNFTLLS